MVLDQPTMPSILQTSGYKPMVVGRDKLGTLRRSYFPKDLATMSYADSAGLSVACLHFWFHRGNEP